MKKLMTLLVAGAAALNANAQNFDFASATNYCPIYLGDTSIAPLEASGKILLDLRTAQIDVWSAGETLTFDEAIGKNSNGIQNEFLALHVNDAGWSGGAFNTGAKDLSKIDDTFYFHIALMSEDADSFTFTVTGSVDHAAALVFGSQPNTDGVQPFDEFARDGEWHAFDIPVTDLKKEGWVAGEIDYAPFSFSLGGRQGAACAMDAIFYYQPEEASGIDAVNADNVQVVMGERTISVIGAAAGIELYDLSGKQVKASKESVIGTDGLNHGIYILKSGAVVKKVNL